MHNEGSRIELADEYLKMHDLRPSVLVNVPGHHFPIGRSARGCRLVTHSGSSTALDRHLLPDKDSSVPICMFSTANDVPNVPVQTVDAYPTNRWPRGTASFVVVSG